MFCATPSMGQRGGSASDASAMFWLPPDADAAGRADRLIPAWAR